MIYTDISNNEINNIIISNNPNQHINDFLNDCSHFLAPKWVPKLMENITFSLLLGVSFSEVVFGAPKT